VLRRLRPLSEAECYFRLYGRDEETVTIVQVEGPRRARRAVQLGISGESLRLLFEERLDAREPDDEQSEAA
jgi:hypothetical protein